MPGGEMVVEYQKSGHIQYTGYLCTLKIEVIW